MAADSISDFKKTGSHTIHLKKVWETKGAKLLLLVVIVLVLFQVLEFQNFLTPSVPIPILFSSIASNQDSSSFIIFGKPSSLSNYTLGFLSDASIGASIDAKDDATSHPTSTNNTLEFLSDASIGASIDAKDDATSHPTSTNNTLEFLSDASIGASIDAKDDATSHPTSTNNSCCTISKSSSDKSPVVEDRRMKKRERKKKKVLNVVSMSDMEDLLSKNRASPSSMIPLWPSEVDEQMLHAKAEIENAPIVTNDEQLYGPVFRNLSTFKRSYELMEKMLKVYVYKDGEKPVFHNPPFVGIYASEGWFMKHMEESTHFLVDDPTKAHLFYIPFSSSRLRAALYIPHSHNHQNLITYLQSYIELVSSKYPFWNRTSGSDHFLAGCHDWATHETENSMKTAVRALCTSNAQGGFEIGKDVSLPATKIYHTSYPQRHIGGKPAHERTTLAFFAGAMHGYLRPILIKYWENKDPDMAISGPIPRSSKLNTSDAEKNDQTVINPYLYYMKSSKYCLCPRGFEVWSTRVMESIYYECVPVIISDNFVPPLFEVLNWSAFSVIVPEKDVPRLKEVLMGIPQQRYLELGRGVREVRKHFLWNTKPVKYDLFHMILHSVWLNRLSQIRVE